MMTQEQIDLMQIDLMRQLNAVIGKGNDEMRRFFQRVDRGDPRVCKEEYANPRYFEKFGYEE